jgi:hypothetical protein
MELEAELGTEIQIMASRVVKHVYKLTLIPDAARHPSVDPNFLTMVTDVLNTTNN